MRISGTELPSVILSQTKVHTHILVSDRFLLLQKKPITSVAKKEEIWLSLMTKAPNPQTNPKATWQHKTPPKLPDRLNNYCGPNKDGHWSNDSHPTSLGKPFYGIQTFPLTTKAV